MTEQIMVFPNVLLVLHFSHIFRDCMHGSNTIFSMAFACKRGLDI